MSPKLRVWLFIFAAGGLLVAFDGCRDMLRPKDSAPRVVTAAEAARLPEGSWVEITGTLNVDALREIKGPFRSTGVFLVQLESGGPSPIIVTSTTRTPAFAELASKGWLDGIAKRHAAGDAGTEKAGKNAADDVDPEPAPALVALFSQPQTFRGLLYKPGGQPMAKSDQIEIDSESIKVAGYCREDGVHCTEEKMVLVTGETPTPRALGIGQAFAGLVIAGLLAMLAITGGKRRSGAAS